ncbi:hypothetical protein QIS74_00454 [Colletotrichum tabaci]|uniref:Uncharacterized protein n=1 Tax=Colletotrichum tabaci TaxID=1209068 RepID=A0AAV9TU54_9PEZI
MIVDFDSYDMNDVRSPLDRLPSILRRRSFFGDTPDPLLSTGEVEKGKQKGPDGKLTTTTEKDDGDLRIRKDSVMTGVEESTSGSSSVSVSSVSSCKRTVVTVRKRVLDVDEEGESSRSAEKGLPDSNDEDNDGGKDDVEDDAAEILSSTAVSQPAEKPSTTTPRRSRFVEDLDDVRVETVSRTPAELCQQLCLPEAARDAAKEAAAAALYFPPIIAAQLESQAARDDDAKDCHPSHEWRHYDGGCSQKKGQRRRVQALARAMVKLAKTPARWRKEDKGKKRAVCDICGEDICLDLQGWARDSGRAQEARGADDESVAVEVAELLGQLYDRDEAESRRRCGVCGQKVDEDLGWEKDGGGDAREPKGDDGAMFGSSGEEGFTADSVAKAVIITEMPEAWWTRRFRI